MVSYPEPIRYRIHLRSSPQQVFELLSTAGGRERFWARSAPEEDGHIAFRFLDGSAYRSRVFLSDPPSAYEVGYFGGSRVRFELHADGSGGTDLMMTERDVPESHYRYHVPGWIPVLLSLKAAADFGIDLRNEDPDRSWEAGYVDV